MNDRVRPGLSISARDLEEVLEELDRARIAILARSGGNPLDPAASVENLTANLADGPPGADPAPPTVEGDGFEDAGLAPTSHYRNAAYVPRAYAAPVADTAGAADGGGPVPGPNGNGTGGNGAGGNGANGNGAGGNGAGGNGAGGNGAGGNGNGGSGNGGKWARRGFRMNPFAGPGRIDPTIQFVQTAIVARPEQTEEILAAALRISPAQAERIILAAIRANPDAKAQILRIARSSGSIGVKSALSLLLALFLFEVFGMGSTAEAKEDPEATSRRSGSSESFAAWFTTAAVALAILFDADAIQSLRHYLDLGNDHDLDFAKVIDKLADGPAPDIATVAAAADELGFDIVTRDGDDGSGAGRGRSGGDDLSGPPLGGLDALGGLGDETLARNRPSDDGARHFVDPDFSSPLTFQGGDLNLLGDEVNPDSPPPDPADEEMPVETPGETPAEPPGASLEDVTAGEGDGAAVFTITRASGAGEASVDFTTANGSAIAGQDYAATSGTVHFADGQTAVTVTVALFNDNEVEPSETFQLVLSDPENLVLGDGTATATILDDEVANLTWSVTGNQLVSEGDAAAYTITMAGGPLAPGQEASVRLRLALPGGLGGADADDFTATFLSDVQAAIDALGPGAGIRLEGDRLVFTADAPASLTLYLETADDSLVEGPENYTLLIEAPSTGGIAAGDGLVTTAIEDNDAGAIVWHLEGDQLTAEGGAATYRVSFDGATLAPGHDASIALSLNLPGGIGGADSGDFSADLAASLQAAIDALGPDPGVRLEGGRLVFDGGGPTELVFVLPIADDSLVEGPENYTLRLDAPSDGAVAPGDGLVTTVIGDDDAAQISWSLTGDSTVSEGAGGAYIIRFDGAELGAGQEASVALNLDLPGGPNGDPDGAGPGDLSQSLRDAVQAAIDDLGPSAGIRLEDNRLIFSAGAPRSLAFRIDTVDDRLVERTESFRLSLAAPNIGLVAAAAAAVSTNIVDNDAVALVWRLTGDQLVSEGGAPRYTIALGGAELADGATASIDLAINLPDSVGGANSADFSEAFYRDIQDAIDGLGPDAGIRLEGTRLVFADGADSFTFTLPTADDSLAEGPENYTVIVGAPSAGTVDPSARLVTTAILDNDGPTPMTGTQNGETLVGDSGPNDISGLAGDDVLLGGGGADILRGGSGNDRLDGGAGADRLIGGAGADMFIVDVVDLGSGIDRIVDFRPAEGDSLHVLDVLTGFDSAMVDIDAFIRFQETQDGTMLQIDTDGPGTGAGYVDAVLLEAIHGVTIDQLMADQHLMVS